MQITKPDTHAYRTGVDVRILAVVFDSEGTGMTLDLDDSDAEMIDLRMKLEDAMHGHTLHISKRSTVVRKWMGKVVILPFVAKAALFITMIAVLSLWLK